LIVCLKSNGTSPNFNSKLIRGAEWLKDNGVIQSMSRKGVMNGNAEMESFFHSFKAERIY